MKKIKYLETSDFRKDLSRLCKKYRTLPDDINTAKVNAIELFHIHGLDNQSVFPIPSFCNDEIVIYKIKKFTCKALRGRGNRSGMRLIYAFLTKSETVEFIEIYFKDDKENEDKNRIRAYLEHNT